jgi:hypothetical protein
MCVRRLRRETDHRPPSSVKVKYEWSYTFILTYAFMISTEITLVTGPMPICGPQFGGNSAGCFGKAHPLVAEREENPRQTL